MRRIILAAFLAGFVGVPAKAGPLNGVFTTEAAQCALIAEKGSRAVFDHDMLLFTLKDGIVGNEYFCDIARLDMLFDGEAAVATMFCQEPGFTFPDLISISTYDETRIELNSSYFSAHAGSADDRSGQMLFSRCDQIKELKLD